jgi:hypothetical protein
MRRLPFHLPTRLMGMPGDRIRKRSLHLRFRRHDKYPHNTFGRAKLRIYTGCAHTLSSLYLAFEISPPFLDTQFLHPYFQVSIYLDVIFLGYSKPKYSVHGPRPNPQRLG